MEHDILTKLHACRDGVLFASRYPSIREAWDACERSEWLLWYAERRLTGEDHRRTFVRISIDCARLVLPLFDRSSPGDRRVRDCLDVTQRWIDGTATLGDVEAASAASAASSAAAASASAASSAAYAAASAASSASASAAYAASSAAYASAAYAASSAAYASASASASAYAAYAAYASASAAYAAASAAYASAYASAYAAYAAYASASASAASASAAYASAAYAAAYAGIDSKFCKIIRQYIPVCP